jgi:hypothetical protein
MSNASFFCDRATHGVSDRERASGLNSVTRQRAWAADRAVHAAQRLEEGRCTVGTTNVRAAKWGPNAKIGRTLAGGRRAATERALGGSERCPSERQRLELANGLEPLDRERDGRQDRLRGHETARKAGIFAIGRRGMPVMARRVLAGGVMASRLVADGGSIARQLSVTAMRRMIVQGMNRRRRQQIAGERENNGNSL